MTKDRVFILKDFQAMHEHALKLKTYYFKNFYKYLATDPDAIFILTEAEDNIRV